MDCICGEMVFMKLNSSVRQTLLTETWIHRTRGGIPL